MALAMPEVRAWSSCNSCEAERSKSSTSRLMDSFQGRNSTGLFPLKVFDLLDRSLFKALLLSFANFAICLMTATEKLWGEIDDVTYSWY